MTRITWEDTQAILSDLMDELPQEFFHELHGGVILQREAKKHAESQAVPLYTMGEYRYERGIGRSIVIFYGSFQRVYGQLGIERYTEALRRVLRHEFRHHVETLAGSIDLILEDKKDIAKYHEKYGKYAHKP